MIAEDDAHVAVDVARAEYMTAQAVATAAYALYTTLAEEAQNASK
jgi:hypothetical protein